MITNRKFKYLISREQGHHRKNEALFGEEGEPHGGKLTGQEGADFGYTDGRLPKKAPVTPESIEDLQQAL